MTPLRVTLVIALLGLLACKKSGGEQARPPEGDTSEQAADAGSDGKLEDPEESPYLDVSNFNAMVESHHPEVVACWRETAGKAADAPKGRVKTTLVIDADGRVKKVDFDAQRSTLKDPALDACIKEKASQWRFNISLTGADTPMPYTFDFSESGLLRG
ncbi:MAG TPA: AgmX/PglI C-terminal domain-containing protein [Nannocystis sp.]|jgi:hypothetical protein